MGRRHLRHLLRVICVNDVYTFSALDGHGGWSRAADLMRRLHEEVTGDGDGGATVLTTANGDVLGGSSLLQHSRGMLAVDVMNEIPIDACVVGNHEFDYGDDALRQCIAASKFKWFGSNVRDKESGEIFDGVFDYEVLTLPHGLKVGLFGLCTRATPSLSHPSDRVGFADLESTARRVVTELRERRGTHIVVALTHVHANQDRDLASSVPGIDLILGGHDHEPLALQHHHALLFKCGQNGYWVGLVDLDVDFEVEGDSGTPAKVVEDSVRVFPSWHMHSTRRVDADPGIESIVDRYQRIVDRKMLESFGGEGSDLRGLKLEDSVATVWGEPLDTRTAEVRRRETTSGNLIADAMLSYYSDCANAGGDDSEIETLAMINGGFIRGDTQYPSGMELTLRHILEELPFPKAICLLQISGKHLRQALEQQLRACPVAMAAFPHVSHNVKMVFDAAGTAGSRVRSLTVNGRDVVDGRKYRVAVTDFIASGGDGCSAWCCGIRQGMDRRPSKRIALVVLEYLRKHQKSELKLQSRVVRLDKAMEK